MGRPRMLIASGDAALGSLIRWVHDRLNEAGITYEQGKRACDSVGCSVIGTAGFAFLFMPRRLRFAASGWSALRLGLGGPLVRSR